MSRSEKGYFKKIYSQSGLGKKNQYLELFDAIDVQEEYNGEALAHRFADKQIFTQLSVAKNYLYKIILKSLRSFHSQASIDIELNEILINVEILYNKHLLEACKKELDKAEELTIKYEIPQKYSEIARWKKAIINQKLVSKEVREERKELYEKEKQFLEIADNLSEYTYLSYQLYSAYTQSGMSRNTEMQEFADEIIHHPLLQDETQAKSIRAKSFYYNILAKYYEIRNDFEKTHLYNKQFIALLENTPDYIQPNLKSYIPGLYNFLLTCSRLKKHDDFFITHLKLKAVPEKYNVSDEYKVTINLMALNVELFYLLNTGNFQGALIIAEETIKLLNEEHGQQTPHLYIELYYFIAYAYFGNGSYNDALVWLNHIINHSTDFPREDMLCYARILNLVCHFEIGNERFVDYNLKSTYRFLSKMNKVYKFEMAMMSFIRTMLKVSNRELLNDKLLDLKEKLLTISKDTYEQNAFEYFDFIAWLDSKLENRNFSDLVREKNMKVALE